MKVSLICTETWTEVIPECEMTFVNAYGHQMPLLPVNPNNRKTNR